MLVEPVAVAPAVVDGQEVPVVADRGGGEGDTALGPGGDHVGGQAEGKRRNGLGPGRRFDLPRERFGPPLAAIGDPRSGGRIDWPLVTLRIAGAALVVPVMEELFWRSFLLRWIDTPGIRCSDAATLESGNLPMSSAEIASTTPIDSRLMSRLRWRDMRSPVTTTSSSFSPSPLCGLLVLSCAAAGVVMANANRLDAPASAFFVVSFCMDCPLQAPAIDRSFAIAGDPARASLFCLGPLNVTGTTI